MAIYTISIAAVWQASGFAMALFLAGLRSLDADLYKAAQIDGAKPLRMYIRILIPAIWPIVVSVLVILLQMALKTYDLVQAMTAGGPGIATMLPTNVVYDYMFQRGQMGAGSAAAVMLLMSLLIIVLPYVALQQAPSQKAGRTMAESGVPAKQARVFCLYAVLVAFAAFYLTPLAVVFLNSFRSLEEITQTSVLGLPHAMHWENWAQAWGSYCIGGICSGISPYMWNSVAIAVPATILSTLVGALNGYLLSLWRFKGSQIAFGVIVLSAYFCPRK